MSQTDARVRYTRMVIENSFVQLLKEKPLSRITVTELCQRAQINRATFYKHYLDVPDLMDKIENQLLDQLKQGFENKDFLVKQFMPDMFRAMQRDGERLMVLASDNGDPNLMTRSFQVCYESVYPHLETILPPMEEDTRRMLYNFLAYGCGGMLRSWVQSGMTRSPEEMAALILKYAEHVLDGVCKGVLS